MSINQTHVAGRIDSITRASSSRNGNPRFIVRLKDGRVFSTAVDAGVAYGIENSEYTGAPHRDLPVPIISLTLNGRGNIVGITVLVANPTPTDLQGLRGDPGNPLAFAPVGEWQPWRAERDKQIIQRTEQILAAYGPASVAGVCAKAIADLIAGTK